MICVAIGFAGCDRVENEQVPQESDSVPVASEQSNGNQINVPAESEPAKEGWALYSSPEKDFSVMAPKALEVKVREAKVGKFREYVFRKGEAYITVTIHTDRKEPLAGNSVEELNSDTSDYLSGSVKDISLATCRELNSADRAELANRSFENTAHRTIHGQSQSK